MIIENWFLNNSLSQNERLVIESSTAKEVVDETEKAILVKFFSDYGNIEVWLPKSVVSGIYFTKGTGKMIRTKLGEIKEVSNINGNLVKTTDGKTYVKFAVEFI